MTSDYVTKIDLQFALDGAVQTIITEMGIRFGEVNQRLDGIDTTLVHHEKQLAAGARAIAGFNEWVGKADADYTRAIAELSESTTFPGGGSSQYWSGSPGTI